MVIAHHKLCPALSSSVCLHLSVASWPGLPPPNVLSHLWVLERLIPADFGLHIVSWASINWSSCFIESAVVRLISVRERMFFSPELTSGELTNGIFNTALLTLY